MLAHAMQVLTSRTIDALAGRHLLFKAELFQRSGSFKIRGAANAVFSLSDSEAADGVITHRCAPPIATGLCSARAALPRPTLTLCAQQVCMQTCSDQMTRLRLQSALPGCHHDDATQMSSSIHCCVRCSSGNHGAALALAAQMRGCSATVIVPHTTPACKTAAIRAYGARVITCDASMDARERALEDEMAKCPAGHKPTFVPPYNGAATIAGQGTMALELLEQAREWVTEPGSDPAAPAGSSVAQCLPERDVSDPAQSAAAQVHTGREPTAPRTQQHDVSGSGDRVLDAVVVPVSGGGMISGIATVIKAQMPGCKVRIRLRLRCMHWHILRYSAISMLFCSRLATAWCLVKVRGL